MSSNPMLPKKTHTYLTWSEKLKSNSKEKCSKTTKKRSWRDKSIKMKKSSLIHCGARGKSPSITSKICQKPSWWQWAIPRLLISSQNWLRFMSQFLQRHWHRFQLWRKLKLWTLHNWWMLQSLGVWMKLKIHNIGTMWKNLSPISSTNLQPISWSVWISPWKVQSERELPEFTTSSKTFSRKISQKWLTNNWLLFTIHSETAKSTLLLSRTKSLSILSLCTSKWTFNRRSTGSSLTQLPEDHNLSSRPIPRLCMRIWEKPTKFFSTLTSAQKSARNSVQFSNAWI